MPKNEEKPVRLIFKTYLKMINNSQGSNLFRNYYVKTTSRGEFDALDDGENSCAFFVSSILVTFSKVKSVHGTVEALISDLKESGWKEVKKARVGDILVWEPIRINEGWHNHIGFFIGRGEAISNSSTKKSPQKHHKNFGSARRNIVHIFSLDSWDQ